jgi:hypothetical protein
LIHDDTDYAQPADDAPAALSFPWPPAEDESPLAALGRTWRGASLAPRAFFRALPEHQGLGPAILYYLIIGIAAAGATLFWTLLGVGVQADRDAVLGQGSLTAMHPAVEFLLSPLLLLLTLFLAAAVTHLLLKLFGGANRSFNFTTRVLAFAYSPSLLEVVPFVGVFLGFVWTLVVAIIGLKEGHRTSLGRVLAAVLIPLVIAGAIVAFATVLASTGRLLEL